MKKLFLPSISLMILILIISSCQKDDVQTNKNYRLVHVQQNNYSIPSLSGEAISTYEGNYLVKVDAYNYWNYEFTYDDNSVSIYYKLNDDVDGWKPITYTLNTYSNDRIDKSYIYYLPDSNILITQNYMYEGEKLVEIKETKTENDTSFLYSDSKYYYESERLSKVAYYLKAIPEEEPIEFKRREFFYEGDNLVEELIYGNYSTYTIELSSKKVYKYDNNNLVLIEHYTFKNNTFSLYNTIAKKYDSNNNEIYNSITDSEGELMNEQYLTYEEGTFNYQLVYNIEVGAFDKVLLP